MIVLSLPQTFLSGDQGPLLLTWIDFNASMGKKHQAQ